MLPQRRRADAVYFSFLATLGDRVFPQGTDTSAGWVAWRTVGLQLGQGRPPSLHGTLPVQPLSPGASLPLGGQSY